MKEVIIRGGGDLATGSAHRLSSCGFGVIILEAGFPTVIRRGAAFASAVFEERFTVEGITAVRVKNIEQIQMHIRRGQIPVLIDESGELIEAIRPDVVVDCIMAKRNLGTHIAMAPIVIGTGPGFAAGKDVHAVVETKRGHSLGKVIYAGSASPDTGIPAELAGWSSERLLRAPLEGTVRAAVQIGDIVKKGDTVCTIDGKAVRAGLDGVLRGLIMDGCRVHKNMKIGDIDPRGERSYCFSISDKARAVGGGVLEALLTLEGKRLKV